jgi:RimJ/RimL family protein N-acetyltransferase
MAALNVSLADMDVDGADRAELVAFLTGNRFPFHLNPLLTRELVVSQLEAGTWGGAADSERNHRTLRVVASGRPVGVVRLNDLGDGAPLFDLRLGEQARGHGIGRLALRGLTDLVFTDYPNVDRFEGHTREDNIAMRQTFVRNGWTKEGHFRRAWPVAGAEPVASIAYAILRIEWRTGQRVPLVWDDLAL